MRQSIVLLSYHARPPSTPVYLAPGRRYLRIAALEDASKEGRTGRWYKVAHEPFQVSAIVLAQQRHQLLVGVIRGRELQIMVNSALYHSQFHYPRNANAVGTAFVRRHQTLRPSAHFLFHGGRKGSDQTKSDWRPTPGWP